MGNRIVSIVVALFCLNGIHAQQYYGMEGLINVPSADMDSVPVAHVGAHYLDKHMIPDKITFDGEKYNSATNYLTVQPFRWLEVGYGYTLEKFHRYGKKKAEVGFYSKDRYFSLRVQPIREARWWPSVVVGGQDILGSGEKGESTGSDFYTNYYVAVSKHQCVCGQWIGVHVAYRHWKQKDKWKRKYNEKWNGVVGGMTFQPSFYKPLRLIGEYDGDGVNVGVDCTLFRYVMLQASMQKCKYFSGGVCLRVPLVRMNK